MADTELRQRAWDAAAAVADPEIPVLSIADLGVLRDVKVTDGRVEVVITPTYSGCPAMNVIALNVEAAVEDACAVLPNHSIFQFTTSSVVAGSMLLPLRFTVVSRPELLMLTVPVYSCPFCVGAKRT